jgi:hypothetical protein
LFISQKKFTHTPKRCLGRYFVLLVFIALSTAPVAFSQAIYGTLTGTIKDNTGALVPDVPITITNQGTRDTRNAVTDSAGSYRIVNILPGSYTITASPKHGFAVFKEQNLVIDINRETRVDISLQQSTVSQVIEVTDAAPILQTETAEVNHEISQDEISQLPITGSQGRNFESLYTLIPGFANVGVQNSVGANPGQAFAANVNGTEDMGVTTRIDGAVNMNGWLPYLIAYVPPADAVQSVNVVTNSFNAEQGMAGGAAINVTIKSGQRAFHGGLWEYNQLFNTNARGYTAAPPPASVPKNIFNQFGYSIGGPIYLPKILTGKKRLFFYTDFERTTRRQTTTALQTIPTTAMIGGDFSSVIGLSTAAANTTLYDPQPGGVVQTGANTSNGYLNAGFRPTFMSEYGCNCIPKGRISPAAASMIANLLPIASVVGTPTVAALNNQLQNDYLGSTTTALNRNELDAKVTYVPSESTSIFGRYSVSPYSSSDPEALGAAGGIPLDGGVPGLIKGRIQNIGLGVSHVVTSNLVLDADFGFTRQYSATGSPLDQSLGDYGANVLNIPGTNGVGPDYVGQPGFLFNGFTSIGNPSGANPFTFRDNQYTADVNASWNIRKHATKFGFSYYHFMLNHFQPSNGAGVNNPRGAFYFQGGLTTGPGDVTSSGSQNNTNSYLALADYLLGLPNEGTTAAVGHVSQLSDPNSLRWSNLSAYAEDQWQVTEKLTFNYGVRYEFYPAPYRDHTGVFRLDPSLPQTANVVVGGVGSSPYDAGIQVSKLNFVPRLGLSYRISPRIVVRSGAGITTDPDSLRFLRDSYPEDLQGSYAGTAANTIAINPSNNQAITLATGIPGVATPNFSSGFASLPVAVGTNTTPANYRRGYIESWNLFLQQDLGHSFVANIGYVGTHQVRQLASYSLNAAPLPTSSTICMANGTYNPSTGLTGSCSFQANTLINTAAGCTAATGYTCYNTGGITMNQPIFSSNYNGMQAQLTRNAGRLAQFGLVYTWSHAFNYEDNGAGSGSTGAAFSYPSYFKMNRATASYDRTNNLQFWTIYHLPFGRGQALLNHGIAGAIVGGLQLNGQISHTSGAPFSVSPSNTTGFNSPGNTLYADLVKPYRQLGGHNRTAGSSAVSGGMPWFDPSAFANPVEVTGSGSTAVYTPHFGNTYRNEFRGPGQTTVNASVFRSFHVYRETQFQVRVEAFNLLNHPLVNSPNVTVGGGTFGYITSFGATRSLQYSGRFTF